MATPTSSSSSSANTSSSNGDVRVLTLQSIDGRVFEVKQHITTESVTIKGIVEQDCTNSTIPVINITGQVLARAVEWLNTHETGEDTCSMATPTSSSSSTNASSTSGGVRLLTLQSTDGNVYEVKQHITTQLMTIKGIVEQGCINSTIPTVNFTSQVLMRVMEWLNMHETCKVADMKELNEWETRFITINNDKSRLNELYDLMHAANYLNVPELLNCCYKEVAANFVGRSVAEIREFFDIRNDFTAGEEEQARQENQWGLDPKFP